MVVEAEAEEKVRVAEQNTVERRAHGERLKDAGEPGAVVPELLSRAKTEAEAEAEVKPGSPAAVVSGTSVVSHTSQTVDACDAARKMMEAATAAKARPTASRYLNPLCSTLEPGVATGSISCALA